jgi:hypothetical protein
LSDFFLSEVVSHPYGAVLRNTESPRQSQQSLGDPACDVSENEVGGVVVGAPHPPGQQLQEPFGDFGVTGDPLPQHVMVTACTAVMAVAFEVRGPGSKIERSPNMSEGPAIANRCARPSRLRPAILTLPDKIM